VAKITNSMKMIANAKFAAARQRVERQRPFTEHALELMDKEFPKVVATEESDSNDNRKHLVVIVTSDKGLCGAANSSVVRSAIAEVIKRPDPERTGLILLGEKSKAQIKRRFPHLIHWSLTDIGGTKRTSYMEACLVADKIVKTLVDKKYERLTLFFNHYVNTATMLPESRQLPSMEAFAAPERLTRIEFDADRDEVLQDYYSFHLANVLYASIIESQASELASRMSAMDSATKNAKELSKKLTIKYNRARQASITTEITEIVSGAAAIAEMDKDD